MCVKLYYVKTYIFHILKISRTMLLSNLFMGRPSYYTYIQYPMPTQPYIPPGSINQVPALALAPSATALLQFHSYFHQKLFIPI